MRIVSVSGACSRSGKTAAAVSLLRELPGAAAVKFTVTEDVFERCPRGTGCTVCDIAVPFRLVDEPAVLGEPGTDTCRLAEAGAARVLWAITRRASAAAAWAAVRGWLGRAETVVMEGSTVVALARPRAHVFVAHPFLSPARWKTTTAGLVAAADAVVVNLPRAEARDPDPAVLEELRRLRGGRALTVADVTGPVSAWAPALMERMQERSALREA